MNTQFIAQKTFYFYSNAEHKQSFKMQNVPLSIQELILHYFAIVVLLVLLKRLK